MAVSRRHWWSWAPQTGSSPPSASAADLIGNDLSKGIKSGYAFTMVGTATGYEIQAAPTVYKVNGSRSFFTDQTNVIRVHNGDGQASATDPDIW